MMSQEEKEQYIINRNREALEHKMNLISNYAVDIEEDSMDCGRLPHAHPPNALRKFLDIPSSSISHPKPQTMEPDYEWLDP